MPRYRINTLRLPESLASKIKRSAKANANTINGEVVARIEASFENETAKSIEDAVADLKRVVRKQLEAAE